MRVFVRFVGAGVVNTLAGYAVIFACMYLLGLSPEVSNAIGYAVGLTGSYLLNKYYTFRSAGRHSTEVWLFLIAFAIAYTANLACLVVLVRLVEFNAGVSQVVAGVVYVGVSYLLNKSVVFRRTVADVPRPDAGVFKSGEPPLRDQQ